MQKLRGPLFRQVVGHNKKTFLAQTQAFGFHRSSGHFKSLAGTNFVCQQSVVAVQNVSNGIALVFPQTDLRVHAHEMNVGTVILAGPGAVKKLIVLFHQQSAPLRVFPDPSSKSVLDGLLFLLGESGFVLVQHTFFLAILLDGIIDAAVAQVQCVLQDFIGIGPAGAVGFGGHNVTVASSRFIADPPFGSIRRVTDGDGVVVADAIGWLKSFHHELLHDGGVKPCGTQTHINFRGFQIFGLGFFQSFNIDPELRVAFCSKLCHAKLIAHIAGKVFVRSLPTSFRVVCISGRLFEDHTGQFSGDALVVAGSTQQVGHVGQVNLAMLANGYRQCFAGGIHAGDNTFWANRPLGEHICLRFEIFILVQILQRAEQIIGAVIIEQAGIFLVVDQTVFCSKRIVGITQLCLRCLDILVREVIQLLVDQLVDDLPQFHHASHTAFGVVGQFNLCHDGVLAVVDFTIHHSIAEILHGRVCGQSFALHFRIGNVRSGNLHRSVLALDVLHRFGKLVCKVCIFDWCNGQVMAVLGAF